MRIIVLSLVFVLAACDPASVGVIELPNQSRKGIGTVGLINEKDSRIVDVLDLVKSITMQMGGVVTPVHQSQVKLATGQQVKSFSIGILLPSQDSASPIKANCDAYISDTDNVMLRIWEWQKFNRSPQVREFIKRLTKE